MVYVLCVIDMTMVMYFDMIHNTIHVFCYEVNYLCVFVECCGKHIDRVVYMHLYMCSYVDDVCTSLTV